MNSSVAVVFAVFVLTGVSSQLNGPNRAQTIGNIFQIPIQTLTSISNVVQNTRPIGEILQQRQQRFRPQQAQQQFNPPTQPGNLGNYGNFVSRAARIAGLYTSLDGSGFRI